MGYRPLNFSRAYVLYCVAPSLKCKATAGLHRGEGAVALETFCSTPAERSIIRNRNR